jgi:hypothetical protein
MEKAGLHGPDVLLYVTSVAIVVLTLLRLVGVQ